MICIKKAERKDIGKLIRVKGQELTVRVSMPLVTALFYLQKFLLRIFRYIFVRQNLCKWK